MSLLRAWMIADFRSRSLLNFPLFKGAVLDEVDEVLPREKLGGNTLSVWPSRISIPREVKNKIPSESKYLRVAFMGFGRQLFQF